MTHILAEKMFILKFGPPIPTSGFNLKIPSSKCKNICCRLFSAALFVKSNSGNDLNAHTQGQQLNKPGYFHTMED